MIRLVTAAVLVVTAATVVARLPIVLDGADVAAWWTATVMLVVAGCLIADVLMTRRRIQ